MENFIKLHWIGMIGSFIAGVYMHHYLATRSIGSLIVTALAFIIAAASYVIANWIRNR